MMIYSGDIEKTAKHIFNLHQLPAKKLLPITK